MGGDRPAPAAPSARGARPARRRRRARRRSPRCSCSPRRCCSPTSPPARSAAPRSRTSRRRSCCSSCVVAARAAAAWGFEVAGRRAATTCSRSCGSTLVERRLRDRPAALDGAGSAEVATVAVGGVDALETTFARYLPQLVLAVRRAASPCSPSSPRSTSSRPASCSSRSRSSRSSCGSSAATPSGERASAGRRSHALATHFLDVVRGLPTLRAFNRGEAQAERIAQVSDEYRRTTMGTLRVAFLSGAVLELAATLGIALVAVTVGVRLVEGGLGFEAGLTVLVLAPELYLPLRNLAAQYHASADGLAVAERLLDLLEEPRGRASAGRRVPPSPRDVPVRLEGVSFAYPARRGRRARLGRPRARARRDGRARRRRAGAARARSRRSSSASPSPTGGRLRGGSGRPGRRATRPPGGRRSPGCRSGRRSSAGTVAENIRLGDAAADDRARAGGRRARRRRRVRPRASRRATTPSSATAAGRSRPASSSGSRSRARSCATRRSSILDEPTANLDPESAELVGEAIERLREGRTVLLIAHRPELARRADRVVTLAAGRIVEPALEAA